MSGQIDLNEILGCTGIVTKPTPAQVEREEALQTRPRKPIKVPEKLFLEPGEDDERAKARWLKHQGRYLNNKQRACSRFETLISVDEETGDPYLYMIFTGIKHTVLKASRLHAALLGDRSPQSRPRTGLKCKAADRILLGVLFRTQNYPDGRPIYESWFNKRKQLVVRFPIGKTAYRSIPLYDE